MDVGKLVGTGLAAFVICMIQSKYFPRKFHRGRPKGQVRNVCHMSLAWSLYFSVDWFCQREMNTREMDEKVFAAIATSGVGFLLIFVADCVARFGKGADKKGIAQAMRSICVALGILVGFGWEKAFDKAVDKLGAGAAKFTMMKPEFDKAILAFVLCALVVPAWRWYILTALEKVEKEDESAAPKEESSGNKVAPSDLGAPLLGTMKEGYAETLQQLEAGNRDLEVSISTITSELEELQNLADRLTAKKGAQQKRVI